MYDVINYVDCTREQQLEILRLRNLDSIRKWMVNPEIITEESHFKFVEKLKVSNERLYFAIYREELLVGTYNLTKEEDDVWERGIFANPEIQGKGETAIWEHQILESLPAKGIKIISAKVKVDNIRSIKYHEKIGYQEQTRDYEYVYYILKLQ